MPGRDRKIEQACLKILMEALKSEVANIPNRVLETDQHIDDDIPTLTIYAAGMPIMQIVVIATDLTPAKESEAD